MALELDKLTRVIGIKFEDHPFLVLGNTGPMGTSSDGIEWEPVEGYSGPVLSVGAWGNDMFLCANTATGAMRRSFDGHTWEELDSNPFAGMVVRDITFGDDRFMVVGVDAATQTEVRTAVLTVGADGGDDWSDFSSPPLTGSGFGYGGAGFAAGQFFIFGSQSFSDTFRDVIGYDFSLNEPIYSNPYTANWTRSRLTRSTDGLTWGGLEDPFNSIDGGTSGTVTITNPAPPFNSVTLPVTDPDTAQASTSCHHIAEHSPEGSPVLVAQQTNVPGQSFAVYGSAWGISGSDFRNVLSSLAGVAYGDVLLSGAEDTIDRFVAVGSNGDGDLGYGTSPDGISWSFTPQGDLGLAKSIVFGENLFVAVIGLSIAYSSLGDTWTEADQSLGATLLTRVIY